MRLSLFFILVALVVSFIPTAHAVDPNSLVTCDGSPLFGIGCDFCTFVTMIHKVGQFLVGLLIILATIMLAITGVQMVMDGGNGNAREVLKERLQNIIIGFLFIIASWTLIDVLMKALVSDASLRDSWSRPIAELCATMEAPVDTVREGADAASPID